MSSNNTYIPLIKTEFVHEVAKLLEESNTCAQSLIEMVNAPSDIQRQTPSYLPESILQNVIFKIGQDNSIEQFIIKVRRACITSYVPRLLRELSLTPKSTVREAIYKLCSFVNSYVSNNTELKLEKYYDSYWLARYKSGVNEPWYKYSEIFSIIFMDVLIEILTKEESRLRFASIKNSESTVYFDCCYLNHVQIYTNRSATAIKIDNSVLERPLSFMTDNINRNIQLPPPIPKDFLTTFKIAIKPYLTFGRIPISQVKNILNIEVRTLQRELNKFGVTFTEIIEEIILGNCLHLLANSNLPITDIATSAGYADTANFTRFIRRKIGCSPSKYRQYQIKCQ
ncbi:helix-turn-helix domain-containing protein [Vibrio mediterranei]|uniref:helix-turn-helix domain-containing protein n=1 Tax=Vibrio mediterranei TaxID=689 RepID=UPI0038CECD44